MVVIHRSGLVLHNLHYIFDVAPPCISHGSYNPSTSPIGSEVIGHWSVTNQLLPNQKPMYTLIRRRLAINKQKLSTLKEGRQELTGNSLSLANTLLTRRRSGCHPVPPGQPDRHLLPILPAFNLTIEMLNNRLVLEAQTSQTRNSLLQIER